MRVVYNDGILNIEFNGKDKDGIELIERIADYEESKYEDYNADELLNAHYNSYDNFDWFKDITGGL